MRRNKPYSLAKRIGLVFTITLLLVIGFLEYVEFSRISYRILEEELNELENIIYGFEGDLSGVIGAVGHVERDGSLDRDERILAINRLLQPIVELHTAEHPVVTLGYYSKRLEAVVAITPWDEMGYLLGHTFSAEHPSKRLYSGGPIQREMATVPRGRVAQYNRLVYSDGQVVGHTWANIPIQFYYGRLVQATLKVLPLILLALVGGVLLYRSVSQEMTRSTNALTAAMDRLANDMPQNQEKINLAGSFPIEFQPLLDRFIAMRERLDATSLELTRLATFGELAAIIVHDIKNPLAVIHGTAQLGQTNPSNEEKCQKRFGQIVKTAEDIDEFLVRILKMARPTHNDEKLVSMNTILQNIRCLWEPVLVSKDIQLVEADCGEVLPLVRFDYAALQQILQNLLKNAVEAMPNGGTITVTKKRHPSNVEISISDTGKGIPEELKPRVFQQFFTTKDDGTGIGLASAYSTIKDNDGSMWFESTEGKGTTFYIQLPIGNQIEDSTSKDLSSVS